ncbi:type II toxin-antitoxin system VapC family toxin [bacterium]|nr:MAG: type II toxin-antitoxin system VapC family toxin [bacterium]
MILVDANILLYAEDQQSSRHVMARQWWDAQLSGASPVCLCWTVLGAFIRIGTNPRVFEHPLSLDQALSRVQSWLDQPCMRIVHPTDRHWIVFQKMLTEGQAVANLVTDAHLAALAIEHGCELISTDTDFSRFPGVKWKNPLK